MVQFATNKKMANKLNKENNEINLLGTILYNVCKWFVQ